MARRRSKSTPASRRRAGSSSRSGSSAPWLVALLILGLGVVAWIFRSRLGDLIAPPAPVKISPVTGMPAPRPVPPPPPADDAPLPTLKFTPPPPIPPPPPAADETGYPRIVANLLEAQIALARRHISSGSIDGVPGAQTAAALTAFQEDTGLPPTGQLDSATRGRLILTSPAFATHLLTPDDFEGLLPLAPTWLGKSEQPSLAHESLLERLAERTHAHPNLLRRLNPSVVWENLAPGATLTLPAIGRTAPETAVAHLHVRLAARILQARDAEGRLVAHFPVSIAKKVDKRPVGALRITVVVPDPNYTFDPEVFPESAEAKELGRKLILQPGPNNPVGVAWIGLDRPGYGIHGTPSPEQVGRTESHGCFRLANWDARALLSFARPGLPVYVEP